MTKGCTNEQHVQAFRASSASEILEIPTRLDTKTGQHIVLWKDIQLGFENVKCIKKGGVLVLFMTDDNFEYLNPLRIKYHPDVVLDIIVQGTNRNNDSTIPGSSSSSVVAESDSGLLHDTPASSEIGINSEIGVSSEIGTSSEIGVSGTSLVGEGSVKEDPAHHDDGIEADELSQTMAELSVASTDEEVDNSLIQSLARSQAILSQEYKLHDRTIPRLFIVLPKTTRLRNSSNKSLYNHFQLYFLCQCGAHTLSKGTKLKHEIHFTNHEGYVLERPNEFFKKYGSDLLAMMQMIKHGIIAPGHIIRPQAYLKLAERFGVGQKNIVLAKHKVGSLLDAMTAFLQEQEQDCDHSCDDSDADIEQPQPEDTDIQSVADLRELKSFLRVQDQDQGFGGLYRIVTPEGHVKWICHGHYREIYQSSAIQQLQSVVKTNHGTFIQETGKIIITLASNSLAKRFYGAIVKCSSVQDLDITLKWDATLDDLRAFATAVTKSAIVRLNLNGSSFKGPARDHANDSFRYDPIMQLMSNNRLQELRLKDFDRLCLRTSSTAITMAPRLRVLSFASDIDLKTTAAQSALSHILENSPSLVELSLDTEEIHFLFDIITEKLSLLPNLMTMHVYYMRDDEPTLTVNFSNMKVVAATMTKYRKENISATDREVFETGHLSKVLWKGTPQQEDELKILDLLCRNPKLSEIQMECDPERIPVVINLLVSTRKNLIARGRPSALCKIEFVLDPAVTDVRDFATSTIEFSELSTAIQVSTDINMRTVSPRPTTDHLYVMFHQQGWSIKTLETNATFNDDLAQLLDSSTQFKGSRLTKLALVANSLTPAGLDRIDRVISRSHSLERLGFHLNGLDAEPRLKKLTWLLGRQGSRLNALTLNSKSPDFWMPQLAEALPTRNDLPVLEDFHLLCYDLFPKDTMADLEDITISRACVEWIAAMVSSQPHVLWSSSRPNTPDVFSSHHSLVPVADLSPKVWTSLRSISITCIHLPPADWLTVIEAIDFSALEALNFTGSNFDLEQLEVLVDCILDDNELQVPLNSLQLSYSNLVDYMDDEAPWELLGELKEKAPLLVIHGLERPD